jgi:hypothetical protein
MDNYTFLKVDGLPEVEVLSWNFGSGHTHYSLEWAGRIPTETGITVRLGQDNGTYLVFAPLEQHAVDGREFKYAILRGAEVSTSGSQTRIRETFRYRFAPCWVNRFDWFPDERPGCIVAFTTDPKVI